MSEKKEKEIFQGIGQRYWWVNEESEAILNRGYLLRGETIESAIDRITGSMVKQFKGISKEEKTYLKNIFTEIIEKGWVSLSSPIWANMGTERGLPISCNGVTISDSMSSISSKLSEVMMQTKLGAGTSGYFGNLRGRGAAITNNGVSSGSVSFMELFNTTMNVVSQGSTRRGSFAAYLDIDHPDIEEFLTIKDISSPIQNLFYGVCVPDYWMKTMINEEGTYPEETVKQYRKIWSKVLESRQFKGLPYIFFTDNVNKNKPDIYKELGSKISHSNLCFSGDTWVGIFDDNNFEKYVTFEDLYEYYDKCIKEGEEFNEYTFTYDEISKEFIKTRIKKVFKNDPTTYFTIIHLENREDFNIKCTPDHKFLLKNGFIKQAQELVSGDVLLSLNDDEVKVKNTETIIQYVPEPVYCLEVDNKNHNFTLGERNCNCLVMNCSEINLPDSESESFVCCLSSMNLELFDEWYNINDPKYGRSIVQYAIWLLDSVMTEYISKLEKELKENPHSAMRNSLNFSKRHRSIGLGTLGLHSYYQKINRPFEHPLNIGLNKKIFSYIREESEKASDELGERFGYAPIFDEISEDILEKRGIKKKRCTTLLSIAPTTSSSAILGQVSPGIEPFTSNFYKVNLAKGNFIRKNKYLDALLNQKLEQGIIKSKEQLEDLWTDIMVKQGSVQHISEDILSKEEKDIFKTFKEISQYEIIVQASERQKYIDQSQSLNLNIPPNTPPKEVNKLIIEAWKRGIKTLYYQRSQSVSKELLSNIVSCISCEG